jgi:hypothetical protein
VEAQLDKYHQLLKENCDTELAVLNYMLAYVNTTISNFTLRKDYPEKPEHFPEKSMVKQNAKLWYKVMQLHLRDLEDMENSMATLWKSLPLVPNWNTGKIPVHAQFAPPAGANLINVQAYVDTQNHMLKELLSLSTERFPRGLNSSSSGTTSDVRANATMTPCKIPGSHFD